LFFVWPLSLEEVRRRRALKVAGRHNWPPIINLKEADGYYFLVASAQASTEFESKVRKAIVPEILKYAKEFKTNVIEVVGHTDEQPIKGIDTNLDTTVFDVLGLRLIKSTTR